MQLQLVDICIVLFVLNGIWSYKLSVLTHKHLDITHTVNNK